MYKKTQEQHKKSRPSPGAEAEPELYEADREDVGGTRNNYSGIDVVTMGAGFFYMARSLLSSVKIGTVVF